MRTKHQERSSQLIFFYINSVFTSIPRWFYYTDWTMSWKTCLIKRLHLFCIFTGRRRKCMFDNDVLWTLHCEFGVISPLLIKSWGILLSYIFSMFCITHSLFHKFHLLSYILYIWPYYVSLTYGMHNEFDLDKNELYLSLLAFTFLFRIVISAAISA